MTYYKDKAGASLRLLAAAGSALLLTACSQSSTDMSRDDTSTRIRLAQLAGAEGNSQEELALLGPAAAKDRGNATLQTQYANALAKAGRNKDALDVALDLYRRDKTDIPACLLLGRQYVRLDDGTEAAPIYQKVIERDAGNLEALNGLGIAEVMQQALPAAEATFRQAVAIAPADAASRNNLALALTLQHKTDDAIEILEALQQENTTSKRARANLALAYAAAGHRDKAASVLRPAMDAAEVDRAVASYAPYSGPDTDAGPSVTEPTVVADATDAGTPHKTKHKHKKKSDPTDPVT